MKKYILLLLSVCICLSVGILFTACGSNDNHEHTDGDICSVCGYRKEDEAGRVFTEAEWIAALNPEKFKNVTLTIEQDIRSSGLGYNKSLLKCKLTESIIWEDYRHSKNSEDFIKTLEKYIFEADNELTIYAADEEDVLAEVDMATDMSFLEYYTAYVNGLPKQIVDLEKLYTKFKFNEQELCYIANEPIIQTVDSGEGQTDSVEYTVFKVWFSNKKLAKIYVECDEMKATLSYTDYGSTSVEIPEAIKNEIEQPTTYTISYINDVRNCSKNNNPTTYTTDSKTIVLQSLECPGYHFDGWFCGDVLITEIPSGSLGDIILTAKWTEVGFRITYENTMGAVNNNKTSFSVYESLHHPFSDIEPLELNGYVFEGWYYSFGNEGDKYRAEEVASFIGDVVLIAKWSPAD